MHSRFAARCLIALATVLVGPTAHASSERHRWPRWPTEFSRVIAPLRDDHTRDRERDHDRIEAVLGLDVYATALIEPWLLRALGDPSTSVKREALRLCFERELVTCVPSALAIWSSVTEPMLRVAALRVVGLHPAGAGLDALLGALRDDNDTMRAQAAIVLGTAALHGAARGRASAALLAKLGDLSASVRQNAVEALSALGSSDATLPIARLLEDAEPGVRLAAARALGQIGDPRAVAALARGLEAVNEPAVVRAHLGAVAVLPGAAAIDVLLAAFDEPPAGLSATDVADLIGLRPDPEPAVLDGMALRLRDPSGARLALRTLALYGAASTAVLRRELQRGVSPELALEIRQVIATADIPIRVAEPRVATPIPAPAPGTDGLAARRSAPTAVGLAEIDRLAATGGWGPGLDAAFVAGGAVVDHRVELALAAAVGPKAALGRWDRRPVATLVGWAKDRTHVAADRCLALLALGSVDPQAVGAPMALLAADALLADPDPRVRACALVPWYALETRPDARALLDDDPRVRTTAVLLAARRGLERRDRGRIALLAATDPDARVRLVATWARRTPAVGVGVGAPAWHHGGAVDPSGRWMRVALPNGPRIWLPVLTLGGVAFAWSPLPDAAASPEE